jgi:hypothetical protein
MRRSYEVCAMPEGARVSLPRRWHRLASRAPWSPLRLEVDRVGIRGPALGAELRWAQVHEIRLAGHAERRTVSYLLEDAAVTLDARGLPVDDLLELLVPPHLPRALGHPGDDPREVRVEERGFHLRWARGRPTSVRWEGISSVEVTAVDAGSGDPARRLELLADVRLPGAPRPREELLALPSTLATDVGLVAALRRLDVGLPERIASASVGTHELWVR